MQIYPQVKREGKNTACQAVSIGAWLESLEKWQPNAGQNGGRSKLKSMRKDPFPNTGNSHI